MKEAVGLEAVCTSVSLAPLSELKARAQGLLGI